MKITDAFIDQRKCYILLLIAIKCRPFLLVFVGMILAYFGKYFIKFALIFSDNRRMAFAAISVVNIMVKFAVLIE